MGIHNFLDASTTYITKRDGDLLTQYTETTSLGVPRIMAHHYGWWVHVALDDEDFIMALHGLEEAGFSASFLKLYAYAMIKKAWWINLDSSGSDDLSEDFEEHDWNQEAIHRVRHE